MAPTLALMALVWVMPACCCGSGASYPSPGPPGVISGKVLFAAPGTPQPLTVYAVDDRLSPSERVYYTATRVAPPATTYAILVPPGIYRVVARLDAEPHDFGGYTENMSCNSSHGDCTRGLSLLDVWIKGQKTVGGIDIGDWGTAPAQNLGWSIDTIGAPQPDPTKPTPSPISPAFRQLPAAPINPSAEQAVSTGFGVGFQVPEAWQVVKPPNELWGVHNVYVANEAVTSPQALDSNGVFLRVTWGAFTCTNPDWRFVVSQTQVAMEPGVETFYFEEPPSDTGPQPFTGYGLFGDAFSFGYCMEFSLRGVTRAALESNLATFAGILQGAHFEKPTILP